MMGQCKMQTVDCLSTIVFRVRKQWDYCFTLTAKIILIMEIHLSGIQLVISSKQRPQGSKL